MNNQNPADQGSSGSGGNPAWKQYLDQVPEVLKPQMEEVFKQWDAGVQQRLQSEREKFASASKYKDIINSGIDPVYINQAIGLAQQLQQDPKAMAERIHQTFKLDFVPKDAIQQQTTSVYDDDSDGGTMRDLSTDPAFKQMYSMMETMQQRELERERREQEQQNLSAFEEELDSLEEKCKDSGLPFNRVLVTAFMSQGYDGEDAVNEINKFLAGSTSTEEIINNQQTQQNNQQQAPVFIGTGGGAGNGQAVETVNFGDMKKGDLNSMVADYLAKSSNTD